MKNVGLSKAVYLLLEHTQIDAVSFILNYLKIGKFHPGKF